MGEAKFPRWTCECLQHPQAITCIPLLRFVASVAESHWRTRLTLLHNKVYLYCYCLSPMADSLSNRRRRDGRDQAFRGLALSLPLSPGNWVRVFYPRTKII